MTDADRFLPLKPDVFEILVALAEGELHGYALLKVLESRGMPVAASLLYRKLRRLMEEGVVAESARREEREDARRRYYRLTTLGLAVAEAEAARIVGRAASQQIRRLAERGAHG